MLEQGRQSLQNFELNIKTWRTDGISDDDQASRGGYELKPVVSFNPSNTSPNLSDGSALAATSLWIQPAPIAGSLP
jgi:hypothetical protein